MEQKQIKQVREAVRQNCWYKTKFFLKGGFSLKMLDWHPQYLNLDIEQQKRYCISRSNLLSLSGDLDNSYTYIRYAWDLLIENPQKRAREDNYVYQRSKSQGEEAQEFGGFPPEYDFSLVRKLRQSVRQQLRQTEERPASQKPYAYELINETLKGYIRELNTILEARR